MAYIIQSSDFKLEYENPMSQDMNSRQSVEFDRYIDRYAKDIVRQILGLENLNQLNSYLVNGLLPTDTSEVPQKWVDLIKGVEFTEGDCIWYWPGLSVVLVPYVYYHWLKAKDTYVSGVGEVKVKAKNAIGVNITQRAVHTWNDFVNNVQGCHLTNQSSLFYFLQNKEADYPKANLYLFEYKNQLGV